MTRHALTLDDAAKGGRNRGKTAKAIQKRIEKQLGMKINADYIVTVLQNQTVVNTALFIIVAEFWNPGKGANTVGASGKAVSGFAGWLNKLLFTPGGEIGAIQSGITGIVAPSLAKDTLLLALAANIASGGNLAGVLSSSTGFISKLLPAVETGA